MIRVSMGSLRAGALLLLSVGLCHAQQSDDPDEEVNEPEGDSASDSDSDDGESVGLGERGYFGIDTQLLGTSTAKVTTVSVSPTGVPVTRWKAQRLRGDSGSGAPHHHRPR